MRQATVLTVLGVTLGIGAALASGRVLASLLFGVTPRDAISIIAAAVTLGVTALFAAWIPARRAAAVDPIRALRIE
jgi:ABC-type antimicrobial peptide transport system permease subunit